MTRDDDARWLLEAVELSRHCPPSDRAFSVGAVLVGRDGLVLATGCSRETGPGDHAEEVALGKAGEGDLAGATLYTSLEPCSVRLSGKRPCTEHILSSGVRRVVYALPEPPVFVTCRGAEVLARGGVEVVLRAEYGPLVRAVNQHLLGAP